MTARITRASAQHRLDTNQRLTVGDLSALLDIHRQTVIRYLDDGLEDPPGSGRSWIPPPRPHPGRAPLHPTGHGEAAREARAGEARWYGRRGGYPGSARPGTRHQDAGWRDSPGGLLPPAGDLIHEEGARPPRSGPFRLRPSTRVSGRTG